MSLGFLTPAAAAAAPPARSPILDAAEAPGLVLELRDGWQLVTSCGDPAAEARACAETVGFADLSHLTKIEVALGIPTADRLDGLATHAGDGWVCPVRPDLQLIVGHPAARDRLEALAPPDSRSVDLSAALCAIAVVGPLARELFARFCALDLRQASLPLRGFRPGSVARVPGYVLREADQRYLIVAGAAYAGYLWEVVDDAAEQLGGRAVGLDSLPTLEADDA